MSKKIDKVTITDNMPGNKKLDEQLFKKLKEFKEKSATAKTLMEGIEKDVSVYIVPRKLATKAETDFAGNKIDVEGALPIAEIADSVIFELGNWKSGGPEYKFVYSGNRTPLEYGHATAAKEGAVTAQTATIMGELNEKGIAISEWGKKCMDSLGGQTADAYVLAFPSLPHSKEAGTVESLETQRMYMYKLILSSTPANIAKIIGKAAEGVPAWFNGFVQKAATKLVVGCNKCTFYMKMIDLTEKVGGTVKDGYKFTDEMKGVTPAPSAAFSEAYKKSWNDETSDWKKLKANLPKDWSLFE